MTYLRYSYQEGFNLFFSTRAYSATGHGVAGPAAVLQVSLRDRLVSSVRDSPVCPYPLQKIRGVPYQLSRANRGCSRPFAGSGSASFR